MTNQDQLILRLAIGCLFSLWSLCQGLSITSMALRKNLGCFNDSCKENPCQIAKAIFQIFYWWFRRLPFFSVTTAYYTLLCHNMYHIMYQILPKFPRAVVAVAVGCLPMASGSKEPNCRIAQPDVGFAEICVTQAIGLLRCRVSSKFGWYFGDWSRFLYLIYSDMHVI